MIAYLLPCPLRHLCFVVVAHMSILMMLVMGCVRLTKSVLSIVFLMMDKTRLY